MRNIAVFVIVFYQRFISLLLKQILGQKSFCRFSPSCSEYARLSILEHGVIRGGYLSVIRILSCQPYFNLKTKIANRKAATQILNIF